MKPVVVQSFATVGIQIPVFNRNQGNVQAAKAQVEHEREEVERIRVQLMQTAQPLLQQYLISRLEEERYRTQRTLARRARPPREWNTGFPIR